MKEIRTKIDLSDAQVQFVRSQATIVALIGPQGEGKTYAGFWGLANHAQRCEGVMRRIVAPWLGRLRM